MEDKKARPTHSIFTRDATGLVKTISATDVFVFTLMVAGPIIFIPLGAILLPSIYEGVNPTLLMLLVLVIVLPFSYNIVCLTSMMPRAGGDYVFGSRVIAPHWGMIGSFMNLLSMITGSATIGISALQTYFAPSISTYFPQYGSAASQVYTPTTGFLLNVLIIVVLYGIAIASTKIWFYVLRAIAVFGLLMVAIFLGFLFFTPLSTITSHFNSQLATGFTFQGVETNATGNGWSSSTPATSALWAGSIVFVLLFLAAPISAFFAGEIKNASRSMTIGMFGGSVFSWALAALGALGIISVFGYTFMSAFGYEDLLNPTTLSLGKFGFAPLVLAVVGNPTLAFLIGMGFAFAALGFLAGGILPASRILFAWSFDRIIPQKFSSVNGRTNTPIFALVFLIIVVSIVAYISSFASTYFGPFLAFSVITVLAFLPNGITSTLVPFLKKEMYRSAPSIVQKKIAGFPLLTLTGLIHTIAFGTVLVLVFLNPSYAGTSTGTLGVGAIAVILVALVFAAVFYPIARAIRRRQGIELEQVFKQLPPE
jgi:APA family basic amino acid/polyamine antiporter